MCPPTYPYVYPSITFTWMGNSDLIYDPVWGSVILSANKPLHSRCAVKETPRH